MSPSPYWRHSQSGHTDQQVPMNMDDTEATAASTEAHHLLHQPPNTAQNVDEGVPRAIALRLYVSHFLSTWNSRLFEFGAALFLTSIFPGTLLPVSIYSLVRNAGYIIFAHPLGTWISQGNRLNVVRASIVGQRLPVAATCALLLVLEINGSTWGFRKDNAIFAVIVMLAVVEKLCSTMNTISVERDWVGAVSFDIPNRLFTYSMPGCRHHRRK